MERTEKSSKKYGLEKLFSNSNIFTSILKLNVAIALFLISALCVLASPVTVEDGNLNISNNLLVNTDTLFVDANSNLVGIGTSSPSEKLDVAGNITASGFINGSALCIEGDCKTGWSDAGNTSWNESRADEIYVPYSGANSNVDLNSKNLSVGKLSIAEGSILGSDILDVYANPLVLLNSYTTPSWSVFEYNSRIASNFTNPTELYQPSAASLLVSSYVGDDSDYFFIDGIFVEKVQNDGSGDIYSIAGIWIEDQTEATENYAIATNKGAVFHGDKVKINPSPGSYATIPTEALEVVGNIQTTGNVTSAYFKGDGSLLTGIEVGNTSSEMISATTGQVNSTSWNRTGTNVILAGTADNVGIGTGSPSHKLNVVGSANITGNLIVDTTGLTYDSAQGGGKVGIKATTYHQLLTIGSPTFAGPAYVAVDSAADRVSGVYWYSAGNGAWAMFRPNDGTNNLHIYGVGLNRKIMSFMNNTGYVGINNGNPSQQLDVNGSMNIANNLLIGTTGKIMFGENSEIYDDGNNLYIITNSSNVTGLAWFSTNISSPDYFTRTQVYDGKLPALKKIKDKSKYYKSDGSIDHKAFDYSYVSYPVKDSATGELTAEDAVSLVKEIALLKQSVYELKIMICSDGNHKKDDICIDACIQDPELPFCKEE